MGETSTDEANLTTAGPPVDSKASENQLKNKTKQNKKHLCESSYSQSVLKQSLWKLLSRVQLFATPWTIYIVHWILQARMLDWDTLPGSSQPRDWTQVSLIADGSFTSWATREAQSVLKLSPNLPLKDTKWKYFLRKIWK